MGTPVDVPTPTALSLEITSGSHAVLVRVTGAVDMESRGELEDALVQLGVFGLNLDVDLRGVTFMDSAGVSMLVHLARQTASRGSTMTVVAPSDQVRRVLALSGVDTMLTIVS